MNDIVESNNIDIKTCLFQKQDIGSDAIDDILNICKTSLIENQISAIYTKCGLHKQVK